MKSTLIALISIVLLVASFTHSEKRAVSKKQNVENITQSNNLGAKSGEKITTYPEDYVPKNNQSSKIGIIVGISLVIFLFVLALFGAKPSYAIYDSSKRTEKRQKEDELFRNEINAALDKDGFPKDRLIARLYITELMRDIKNNGDPTGRNRKEMARLYEKNGLDISK